MKLDVILPAGGRITDRFAVETGVTVKTLLTIDGLTVLQRTLHTLRSSERVNRCVLIGPDEVASHPAARMADIVLPESNSGPDNIFRGIQWLMDANGGQHAEHVLVVTTDLPFLSLETVHNFLDACPSDVDICGPLIHRDQFETKFPNCRAQYVHLKDGEWTMGCAFLLNPAVLLANRSRIDEVFAARKSQLGMARLLGLGFIMRFLTHTLTVDHIQQRCSEILSCSVCGVRNSAPELAYDIDDQDEYVYALKMDRARLNTKKDGI